MFLALSEGWHCAGAAQQKLRGMYPALLPEHVKCKQMPVSPVMWRLQSEERARLPGSKMRGKNCLPRPPEIRPSTPLMLLRPDPNSDQAHMKYQGTPSRCWQHRGAYRCGFRPPVVSEAPFGRNPWHNKRLMPGLALEFEAPLPSSIVAARPAHGPAAGVSGHPGLDCSFARRLP